MINRDTHIIIELPYGNNVPSLAEILKRFKKLYVVHQPLSPVLTACAEEAEAMMHGLFTSGSKGEVKIQRRRTPNYYVRKTGYHCTSCHKGRINISFRYCPYCGKPIHWL